MNSAIPDGVIYPPAIVEDSTMYEFTTEHPPLFANHQGKPLEVLSEALVSQQGEAAWEESAFGPVYRRLVKEQLNQYKAKRSYMWILAGILERFAVKTERTVTQVIGYSKSKAQAFEQSTSIKVHAGGPAFNGEVQRALKITNSMTEQWSESRTEQVKVTLEPATAYVHWVLLDTMEVQRRSKARIRKGTRGPIGAWGAESLNVAEISSTLFHYWDAYPSPSAKVLSPEVIAEAEQDEVLMEKDMGAAQVWFAVCTEVHNGSMGWLGDDRDEYKTAKADADSHNAQFPGHDADVLSSP